MIPCIVCNKQGFWLNNNPRNERGEAFEKNENENEKQT